MSSKPHKKLIAQPDHVILQRIPKSEITSSGLVLPETYEGCPNMARVIDANGADWVEVGDTVFYQSVMGTEIQLDGQVYITCHREDVIGKLVEVEA